RLGRPTTWAHVGDERSANGVLRALRRGHTFVSHDVDGPQVYLARANIRVIDAHGASLILVTDRGPTTSVTIPSSDWSTSITLRSQYLRAEVRDASGEMLALSNPLYS